ncbi:6-pyruvoyl tetrahydropterin synthase family protein [Streptomyces sp. C10-9-1]|uniref:6-pyruvoyl trahydropterin synthase family protein n=1 Tax=Streptomyces sp. C10-9-1 TaxID=1859285 RepID=UPI0035ABF435
MPGEFGRGRGEDGLPLGQDAAAGGWGDQAAFGHHHRDRGAQPERLAAVPPYGGAGAALPVSAFAAFEASHQLHGLRDGHPCGRLHGHSYVLSVPVSAVPRLGDVPVLLRNHLRGAVHGRVLNEVIPRLNPTSENLARHFSQWLADRDMGDAGWGGACVRVSETETSWAEYVGGAS